MEHLVPFSTQFMNVIRIFVVVVVVSEYQHSHLGYSLNINIVVNEGKWDEAQ